MDHAGGVEEDRAACAVQKTPAVVLRAQVAFDDFHAVRELRQSARLLSRGHETADPEIRRRALERRASRQPADERLDETGAEPSCRTGDQREPRMQIDRSCAHCPRNRSAFRRASAMMDPCGFTPGAEHRMLASDT